MFGSVVETAMDRLPSVGTAAILSTKKMLSLLALSSGFVFATELTDPQIKEWATYGVGGAFALTVFYFYRQQQEASLRREQENAERHAQMTQAVLDVVKDNSKVISGFHETVEVLRQAVSAMNADQQRRYEDSLKDGGRRNYDPKDMK